MRADIASPLLMSQEPEWDDKNRQGTGYETLVATNRTSVDSATIPGRFYYNTLDE